MGTRITTITNRVMSLSRRLRCSRYLSSDPAVPPPRRKLLASLCLRAVDGTAHDVGKGPEQAQEISKQGGHHHLDGPLDDCLDNRGGDNLWCYRLRSERQYRGIVMGLLLQHCRLGRRWMDDGEMKRAVALFQGQAVMKSAQCMLGAGVTGHAGHRQERGHAADCQQVATALRLQPRQRQLHPGQGPQQVDLDRLAMLLERDVARVAGMDDPGIVDQDVEPAK